MKCLTEIWEENGESFACFTACKEDCLNNHESSCRCKVVENILKRLNEYESIGLMPEEIKERLNGGKQNE